MENYVISDQEELLDAVPPFPEQFQKDVKVMKINKSTKFGNIIDFINKKFEDDSVRHIIFEGVGDAADKCISCVEVFKRKVKDHVYQWNALQTARRVTYWDPTIDGLDRLKVTVDTPVMYILISRDQFPVEFQCLSMQCSADKPSRAVPKSTGGPKRSTPRAPYTENKWVRPDKDERDRLKKERAADEKNLDIGI